MSMGKGWIGDPTRVLSALASVRADRDADGNYLIYGEPVISGIDGDMVVPAGTEYSVAGERANLAALLADTGGGLSVTVIA